MLFINQVTPYLRIYVPATEDFVQFRGGKLELDEDDPAFETVKQEALRNPSIVILTEAVQCPSCGEAFGGKTAKAQLGQHRKAAHFDLWVADKQAEQATVIMAEVKARAPHACDLCPRIQEFPDEAALNLHIRTVHVQVAVDENGNVLDAGEGGDSDNAAAAEPEAAPAAKLK